MHRQEKRAIRQELLERLTLELVGPNDPLEVLDERPGQRYLCGILWPVGSQLEPGDDDQEIAGAEGEESGQSEVVPPLMQAMKPSSIGMSFVVDNTTTELLITATWGVYHTGEGVKKTWKRSPKEFQFVMPLLPADGKRRSSTYPGDPDICLEWISRPLEDRIAVSLFLVNRKKNEEKGENDALCLFQPVISVQGLSGGSKPFSVRRMMMDSMQTVPPDVASDELLYRNQTVFATGHGTAVNWFGVTGDKMNAEKIQTITMPFYEVPKVVPPGWTRGGSLDMKVLADAGNAEEVVDSLQPLLDAYEEWIFTNELQMDSLPGELYATAEDHMHECRVSLNRMRKGLELIGSPDYPGVFEAFRFANRVMNMQRRQALYAREAMKSKDWSKPPADVPTVWRPFQIAFILQAIEGIIESSHHDRQVADLLWFPTGGGKTEAYLGLAAFTLALRRLRGEREGMRGDAGVSIIMRYTLRLLTIQQFQRASTLICACEIVRRENPAMWGEEPFRIGLWVGGSNTPNDFDKCADVLPPNEKPSPTAPSPVQLLSCPWCGSPLNEKNYKAYRKLRRVLISCSRKECDFRIKSNPDEGIPAVLSDEEIYKLLPSMIIGTVDKFARMPWVGETQSLIGRVEGQLEGWGFVTEGTDDDTAGWIEAVTGGKKTFKDRRPLLPPDLIIQDELHLISGPLGTMVGIYETAIDWLCTTESNGKVIGPKVIASTATIRRAKEQVNSLFCRNLAIFPSPGLTAGDSFFAEEQPVSKEPGRLYSSVFAPGRSVKTAQVRVYAALLAAIAAMNEKAEDLDPYYTTVGYFNSLRELGGAVRLIEDDVKSRMKVLANRKMGQKFPYKLRKMKDSIPELTSRVDTGSIPGILQRLEKTFYSGTEDGINPVDMVLASNMISVGVDVSRLGLMVVTGQPKTTAEYIQATSRVGREFPGLVIAIYNWARPRDVSHYEQFVSYHAALYRYVEAISVTPFSSRARDRALAATLITMSRLKVPGLAQRLMAGKFSMHREDIQSIKEFILERVNQIESNKVQEVEAHILQYLEQWHNETLKGSIVYNREKKRAKLMYPLGEKAEGLFGVPNSMRDVEKTVGIYLKKE